MSRSVGSAIARVGLVCAVLTATAPHAAPPIADGLACLAATQGADGAWGASRGTPVRDTSVALDTLARLAPGAGVARGVAYLRDLVAQEHDSLARQAWALEDVEQPLEYALDDLLAAQRDASGDPAEPNHPEGGWGLAPGFASDSLTTTLALNALAAAGRSGGLAVVNAVVEAGAGNTHPFTVPPGATALELLVRTVTGTVRFHVATPGGASFGLDLSNVSFPVTVAGIPTEPGVYTLRAESLVGAPNTYSLEARFADASFDVGRLTRARSYLGLAQNVDGSWGTRRGEDGSLMITAETLRTLEAGGGFAPAAALDAAAAWVRSHQGVDGGFASEPGASTVHETALALVALLENDLASPAVLPARAYLLATQSGATGCWNDDPYATALAVRALHAERCPLLGDLDCDGSLTPIDAQVVLCLFVGLCQDGDLPAPCSDPAYRLRVGDWDQDGALTPIDASATLGLFVDLFGPGASPLGAQCEVGP